MNKLPWHSIKRVRRPVYHDNAECTEGDNIETEYKRDGTGGRPRCKHCARLNMRAGLGKVLSIGRRKKKKR